MYDICSLKLYEFDYSSSSSMCCMWLTPVGMLIRVGDAGRGSHKARGYMSADLVTCCLICTVERRM
jgi:hypothetical protein